MYLLQEMPPADAEDGNTTDNELVESSTCSSAPGSPRAEPPEMEAPTPSSLDRHGSVSSHTRKRHDLFSLLNPATDSPGNTPTPGHLPNIYSARPPPPLHQSSNELSASLLEAVDFANAPPLTGYEIPLDSTTYDMWPGVLQSDFNTYGEWSSLFGPGGWWLQSGRL